MKRTFYSEFAYIFGVLLMAIGVACSARANVGMSMVVAPAYAIYAKVSQYWNWFTLGMAQYAFQFILIWVICAILRKIKLKFFLSFITAFIDGLLLDATMFLLRYIPDLGMADHIVFFCLGMLITGLGVALVFHTYLPIEAYELAVKEISNKWKFDIGKVKWCYDIFSLILAVTISFILFGFMNFVGVSWGTLIIAIFNGLIIGSFSKLLDKIFDFKDGLNWRKFFEF